MTTMCVAEGKRELEENRDKCKKELEDLLLAREEQLRPAREARRRIQHLKHLVTVKTKKLAAEKERLKKLKSKVDHLRSHDWPLRAQQLGGEKEETIVQMEKEKDKMERSKKRSHAKTTIAFKDYVEGNVKFNESTRMWTIMNMCLPTFGGSVVDDPDDSAPLKERFRIFWVVLERLRLAWAGREPFFLHPMGISGMTVFIERDHEMIPLSEGPMLNGAIDSLNENIKHIMDLFDKKIQLPMFMHFDTSEHEWDNVCDNVYSTKDSGDRTSSPVVCPSENESDTDSGVILWE
jgi:hypothetical protein